MRKVAHILAAMVAWFIWQKIGGIGGFVVAVLAAGFIEIVFIYVLSALSAPFRKTQSEQRPQDVTSQQVP